MILNRIFEISININNPINFCSNKEHHILIELNNTYVNKCFMRSFIIRIIEILNISSCKIINTNSSSKGIINVRFMAEVFVLNNWDILIGSTVKKNQPLLQLEYKKNNVEINSSIKPTNIQSNLLSIGQLVPIRIIESYHKPMDNSIYTASILLTCDKKCILYKIKGNVVFNDEYLDLIKNIKHELKLREELIKTKQKEIMFFESLIYSYNNADTNNIERVISDSNDIWTGPKNITKNQVFNILNIKNNQSLTGYWCRSLELYRSSPLFCKYTQSSNKYIIHTPITMLIDMAKNILLFITAIREMVETYNTDELINSHKNIWNIMKNEQLNHN